MSLPQILSAALLGAAALLPALATQAAEAPVRSDWPQFTRIEMRVDAPLPQRMRMTRFDGNELLAEIETPGRLKRHLSIGATQLYHGLEANESAQPGKGANPFMFLGMGFHLSLAALGAAFPGGSAGVPAAEVDREVVIQSRKARLQAHRVARSGRIEFCVALLEADAPEACGSRSAQVATALPDAMPLDGWVSASGKRFATLAEVRATPH